MIDIAAEFRRAVSLIFGDPWATDLARQITISDQTWMQFGPIGTRTITNGKTRSRPYYFTGCQLILKRSHRELRLPTSTSGPDSIQDELNQLKCVKRDGPIMA